MGAQCARGGTTPPLDMDGDDLFVADGFRKRYPTTWGRAASQFEAEILENEGVEGLRGDLTEVFLEREAQCALHC